jgi:hypothetical protein
MQGFRFFILVMIRIILLRCYDDVFIVTVMEFELENEI